MTPTLVVRPLAEADMERAFRWYEAQSPGLGTEFVRSLDASFAAIQRQPESHPKIYHDIRRALLRRFPFAIFYFFRGSAFKSLRACTSGNIPAGGSRGVNDFCAC